MEQTVKQRVVEFIEYKKISVRSFERLCGLSNGYVKGIKHTIFPDKMKGITLQYPELNPVWLLTGEGQMIKNTQAAEGAGSAGIAGNDVLGGGIGDAALVAGLMKSLEKKDEQIDRLLGIIESLRNH
jgi:hypothetical protein